jgi:hypothetical protein
MSQRGISNILPREVDVRYLSADLHLLSLPFWADLLGLPLMPRLMLILGANGMFLTRTSPKVGRGLILAILDHRPPQ